MYEFSAVFHCVLPTNGGGSIRILITNKQVKM